MKINQIDILSALLIIISLIFLKSNNDFWLIYMLGCMSYTVINWKKQLYGQSIMNLIAAFIAVRNFLS